MRKSVFLSIFIFLIVGCKQIDSKDSTVVNDIKIIESKVVKLSDINSACELLDEFYKTYELMQSFKETDSTIYNYIFIDYPMSRVAENNEDEINQKKAIRFFKSKLTKEKVKEIQFLLNRIVILQKFGAKKFISNEFEECNYKESYNLYSGYYNYYNSIADDILINY
jgi:hypothetical protein